MTDLTHSLDDIEARALATPAEEPFELIERGTHGQCDGCSEHKHLVLTVRWAEGEPDLCAECAPANVFALHARADILALAAKVRELEAEVDRWKARRDLAVETCRFRHQDGKTAAEWHADICAAAEGAANERQRAEAAEAAIQRVDTALARVEADNAKHFDVTGHHIPGAVITVAEMVREALAGPSLEAQP